jgi:hypothetical protein
VAGVIATFLAIAAYGIVRPPAPPLTTGDVNQAIASALASQTPPPPRSELVDQAVAPSIVLIQTDRVDANGKKDDSASGLGSGVVVNDAGSVLTALHVVDGRPLPDPPEVDTAVGDRFTAVAHRGGVAGEVDVSELR